MCWCIKIKIYYILVLSILLSIGLASVHSVSDTQLQPELLEIGRIDTGGNAFYLQINNNICVISEGSFNGLKFYDVTDPSSIKLLGTYKQGIGAPHNTIMIDNFVFLADTLDGVEVIDISDPTTPRFISSTSTGGYAWDLQIYMNQLFVVDFNEGLKIFDISDYGNLMEIGSYSGSSFSNLYITDNGLAYITAYREGLKIIDISDPTKPFLVGTYDILKAPTEVVVRDNIAYISDWDNGFLSLDVSDPENPVELAHFDDGGICVALHLENNLAYISEWYNGLEIVDISNPEMLEEIFQYNQTKETKMVHVDEDLIYIADGDNGLVILQSNMQSIIISDSNTTMGILQKILPGIIGLIGVTFFGLIFYRRRITFEVES
jgi:hypothetical protein